MNRSIEHQDASRDMPLGVFLDNELLGTVPDDGPYGYAAAARLAAERGVARHGLEVLRLCHRHPEVSAVDCTDCVPLD